MSLGVRGQRFFGQPLRCDATRDPSEQRPTDTGGGSTAEPAPGGLGGGFTGGLTGGFLTTIVGLLVGSGAGLLVGSGFGGSTTLFGGSGFGFGGSGAGSTISGLAGGTCSSGDDERANTTIAIVAAIAPAIVNGSHRRRGVTRSHESDRSVSTSSVDIAAIGGTDEVIGMGVGRGGGSPMSSGGGVLPSRRWMRATYSREVAGVPNGASALASWATLSNR